MDAPVQMELQFPRSGQRVSVLVPSHLARYADTLRADFEAAFASRTANASAVRKTGEANRPTR